VQGDGRIFRRGRIWWIAYYRNAHEYRESSRATDEETARRLLSRRLSVPTGDSLTMRDLSRSEIIDQLPEAELRKLYADCRLALRRLRACLARKRTTKDA
jgi:hypothetical protein